MQGPVYAAERGDGTASAPARVLLVEDDFIIAMVIEQALLDAGVVIVGMAATADEAVRLAVGERPDLIVMDIRLSGARDGVDAALEIYDRTGIRSIFASAHHDEATKNRAVAARPQGWLSKPYTPEALIRAIRDALLERPG